MSTYQAITRLHYLQKRQLEFRMQCFKDFLNRVPSIKTTVLIEFKKGFCCSYSSMAALTNEYTENAHVEDGMHVSSLKKSKYAGVYFPVLQECAQLKLLAKGRGVHAHMLKRSIPLSLLHENVLITMYLNCGSMVDACDLFMKMLERDVFTWTVMVGGYINLGDTQGALNLFDQMQKQDMKPNVVTYTSVLGACANAGAFEMGKYVHSQLINNRLPSDVYVQNSLIGMYAKSGNIEDAHQVFSQMKTRDIVSWNALISGYVEQGDVDEAAKLFNRTVQCGFRPNKVTYINVLSACTSIGALKWGKCIHVHVIKDGLEGDNSLGNSLICMYAKCGNIRQAHTVFKGMPVRDVISWTVMISGLAEYGKGKEALNLFCQMQQYGIKPDRVTFLSVLAACNHEGLVDIGRFYFDSMLGVHGIRPTAKHYGCMIDLLARMGCLEEAKNIIDTMQCRPDIVVWRAFLAACRVHGNAKLAEQAAVEILNLDPHDTTAFVLLSNTYAK